MFSATDMARMQNQSAFSFASPRQHTIIQKLVTLPFGRVQFHHPLRSPHLLCFHPLRPGRPYLHTSSLRLSSATTRATTTTPSSNHISRSISTLNTLKPYLQSQLNPILLGWTCSSISVFSLSKIIPIVGSLSTYLNNANDIHKIKPDGLVIGVFVLVRLIANYLQQAFLWEAAFNCVCEIRGFVFHRVLMRDLAFFEGENGTESGDVAYRITAEADALGDSVFALLNTTVPSLLHLSAMATQMVVISPVLSLISALTIPFMAFIVVYLGERLRVISRNAHLSIAALSAYLNEVLPSVSFVKASSSESSECVRFKRLAGADLCNQLKKKKMKALIPQVVQAIYYAVLVVICVVSLMLSGGSINGSYIISFLSSLIFLIEPIQGVGKAYNELKQGEPAIERLFELAKYNPQVVDAPGAIDLDFVSGEVKFCNVSFRYKDDLPFLLNKVKVHINAGETVAFVGTSGGGKTTLIKLLLRLYNPVSGCIQIDGHNIDSIRMKSLRRHVGLVSQDITLFSGTVAENIGYRDLISDIDMDRVKVAATTANADEFIRSLPQGYKTNVGPGGSLLSGGQKQRLAIARALYRSSSILILDEATSALDSKSELLVRQAVGRVMEDHTVLVIAHRMETVLMAKRIFLLDKGKLEEISRSSLMDGHHDFLTSDELVI